MATLAVGEDDSPATCLTPKQLRFALPTPPLIEDARSPAPASLGAPDCGIESEDDHSDLDVQLEPYIGGRVAAAPQCEEQESWELPPDLSTKEDSPSPSFAGVLRGVGEATASHR